MTVLTPSTSSGIDQSTNTLPARSKGQFEHMGIMTTDLVMAGCLQRIAGEMEKQTELMQSMVSMLSGISKQLLETQVGGLHRY